MHHTASTSLFAAGSSSSAPFERFARPASVSRWTGRAALTIPLPSLASLRLAHATGGERMAGAGMDNVARMAGRS
jgi:hypothetical protein